MERFLSSNHANLSCSVMQSILAKALGIVMLHQPTESEAMQIYIFSCFAFQVCWYIKNLPFYCKKFTKKQKLEIILGNCVWCTGILPHDRV